MVNQGRLYLDSHNRRNANVENLFMGRGASMLIVK